MPVRKSMPQLLKFFLAYDKRNAKLALDVRREVLTAATDAAEAICDAYNAVAIGYSFTGRCKKVSFTLPCPNSLRYLHKALSRRFTRNAKGPQRSSRSGLQRRKSLALIMETGGKNGQGLSLQSGGV